jgi:hypothetical protein
MSWQPYLRRARGGDYGETVTVPKDAVAGVPMGFEESTLSLPLGAERVYRDVNAVDSLLLREFDDRYVLRLDRYNPEYYPGRHAAFDATGDAPGLLPVLDADATPDSSRQPRRTAE